MSIPNANSGNLPGYICPFCETDCSPIATVPACPHFFAVDGENGWRFPLPTRELFDDASAKSPLLFRDLLYHDPNCRAALRLRRANYDDSLEMYVYSVQRSETNRAFSDAIKAA